jgi:predicted rRNA methylase YqxC with S4 and FtsJ domains
MFLETDLSGAATVAAPVCFKVGVMAKRQKSERFVSRGGDKLDGALAHFDVDVAGFVVADLGANVGGFVDCLLQRGALRIYAVDTGYGVWGIGLEAAAG